MYLRAMNFRAMNFRGMNLRGMNLRGMTLGTMFLAGALLTLAPGLGSTPAMARDAFAAACMAQGKASARACACQARLARKNLNRRERRAALAGLRGGRDALAREIKAMGQKRARVFAVKMRRLGAASRKQCR